MRAGSYPDAYRNMYAKALKRSVSLHFESDAQAKAFRVELYNYRYAVRDELPNKQKHYKRLMQVQLSVKDHTLILTKKKSKFVEKLNDN